VNEAQWNEIVACPACKGPLARGGETLACEKCEREYSVEDGIPRLYPPGDQLTIDPAMLRTKTRAEAARTIAEMNRIDVGLVSRPRSYYAAYLLLVVFILFKSWWGALVVVAFLLADWFVFRARRGAALRRYRTNPLVLKTVADHKAVDDLYLREGKAQPSMSDWVQLARETAGGATDQITDSVEDDERYLDIKRVYDRLPASPDVVVDVGANDGRATTRFRVGAGRTVVGIDVSHLLLKEFLRNLPDQVALQADGACLPLADQCADFLFCTETLEHIPDPAAAVREFLRVLKPGGRMMIQSPNAHRVRNLNPFHFGTLISSLIGDRVLQKKTVHENTWHNGTTYHWDFSVHDYRRMVEAGGGSVLELRSAQFFVPRFLLLGQSGSFTAKEKLISRIPLVRYLGGDLVVVAVRR